MEKIVVLRAMERENCEHVINMFNDPEIECSVGGWAFPMSLFSQKKWLEAHYNDQNAFRFVIDTKENEPVGIIVLTDIDRKNRRASIGVKLDSKSSRFKDCGTDAIMAIMRYVFDELGFHRLDASSVAVNQVPASVLGKCGFVEEGVKREYL